MHLNQLADWMSIYERSLKQFPEYERFLNRRDRETVREIREAIVRSNMRIDKIGYKFDQSKSTKPDPAVFESDLNQALYKGTKGIRDFLIKKLNRKDEDNYHDREENLAFIEALNQKVQDQKNELEGIDPNMPLSAKAKQNILDITGKETTRTKENNKDNDPNMPLSQKAKQNILDMTGKEPTINMSKYIDTPIIQEAKPQEEKPQNEAKIDTEQIESKSEGKSIKESKTIYQEPLEYTVNTETDKNPELKRQQEREAKRQKFIAQAKEITEGIGSRPSGIGIEPDI